MNLNRFLVGLVVALVLPLVCSAAVIEEHKDVKGWVIQTESFTYQIAIARDGIVIPVYFGPSADLHQVDSVSLSVNPMVGSKIREFPFRGGYVDQTPILEVDFADGVRDLHLIFNNAEITTIEEQPTLRIGLKDSVYPFEVDAFYRVFPQHDIIEKWMVLKNRGQEPILVENAMSGSLWLPADDYELTHLSGTWGHECQVQTTRLTPGVKTLQTRSMRSHVMPPWFSVSPAGKANETSGSVWFGGLQWDGNWKIDFEKMHSGHLQIAGGINFWDTSITLKPGDLFTTPKMIAGFADDGFGGSSRRMHDYTRNHLQRPLFRDKLRPVLYNSWYATTFDVNEEHQVALAKVAKEIGVELFVIDDGWFKGRKDDHAGLGDWTVDHDKFPDGLKPMIEKINGLGLDFGIWVEPEMVNPDSDLYRAHPDWVFHYPTRARHEGRNQLILNLAREDVYDYLLDSLSKLLSENNITFIKWDMNRDLTDAGWPSASFSDQHSVRIKYMQNFYRLVQELETRFPDVWFECCSGGGGRIGYGMMPYMDQFWASDNTNPYDRIFIHDGFLRGFPANMMVSWITDENWYRTIRDDAFRYHVSMCGVLGIGSDITQWGKEEREQAANYIDVYKEIRPLVQQGIVHRLISPWENNRSVLEYVSHDGNDAVVFMFRLLESMRGSTPETRVNQRIKLRGLDPSAMYQLSGDNKKMVSGKTLMNSGIPWIPQGLRDSALILIKKK